MSKRNKRSAAQREADRRKTQQKQQASANRRAKWERRGLARQLQREQHAADVYGLISERGTQCSHRDEDGVRCLRPALVGGYYCGAHVKRANTP
jgi:hypothetical protein